mmetsp:Transcript_11232/g.31746  ORF Transcript_11232/g.31746 Transcript_11232/m.31746 type:complete len:219 (+) Transcript_11232:199-855(+)
MFFPNTGEKPPLEISPTSLLSMSKILECCLAGAPFSKNSNPTLLCGTPSSICLRILSPPGKENVSLLAFPMVHVKPASGGVVSSLKSLPYKHKPASNRKESLAPKPHKRTFSSATKSSTNFNVPGTGTEISKPSSPVYPVLVTQHGCPDTVISLNMPKYNLLKSASVNFCNVSIAFGPCNANKLLSECSINLQSPSNFAKCLLMCALSLSAHPAFKTT